MPDRLVRLPDAAAAALESLVMTTELGPTVDRTAPVSQRPDEQWMRIYERDVDVDVLTAVLDGEVGFATGADVAVGRVRRHRGTRRHAVGGTGRRPGRRARASEG